jgi:subtilisin family serine protease
MISSLGLKVKKVWGSWYQAWLSRDQRIQLQQTPGLEKMGDNLTFEPLSLPNDFSTNLWHFKNPLGFDLRAEGAWAISTGSPEVVVGVVDSGIALGHRDLAPNIWVNQAEKDGKPGVDDDGNGYVDDVHGFNFAANQANAQDNRGHGTMVSGLIGAVGDNQFGVMGMSWQVKMMSLNMFPNLWGNATLSSAIAAINYAIDNGAHIINASWGQASSTKDEEPGYDLLREVIARAHEKGILFVAAAGNNAGNNDLTHMVPATLGNPNILSVGAINRRGQAWSKTNFGAQSVHVLAPGEEVMTTSQDGGTRYATGTSLSAPLVTGLAVLMLSVNPNLSPEQIIQILEQSCQPLAPLSSMSRCQGTLDAKLALDQVLATP